MSMQKRALASSSSDQPSQPKRPHVVQIKQKWNGSERNIEPKSCLMEEDGQSEVREELERAKSDSAKCCQRANVKCTAKNNMRNLQLQPPTKLSPPVFTGKKLEAKTAAFPVKEYRGEVYGKHNPPAFDSEVSRLEKNGKSHQKPSLLQFFAFKKPKEEYGEAIMEKAFDYWNDDREFNGGRARSKKKMASYASKTSNGLESNVVRKSCLTEEDIRRVIREELELVESHCIKQVREELELVKSHVVKQVREELELVKSHLPDLVGSHFLNTLKVEVVQEICSSLKDTNRRAVREELEHASSQSVQLVRTSGKCGKKDEETNLRLQFKTRLSLPLFTGQKLEGERGAPIVVVLINANTGNIVESGPESSVKLDVVVLEGDFKKEDDHNWTREEFEKYVVKERDGKRPLLTGNLEVALKGGTGVLGEIEFTDNSSWNRSKKFRMGLQVSPGYCENIRIREAKTEAFIVKEHRGESYKKHYPPASDDEVWRLDNIAKNGSYHKRLNEAGIYKVEEFSRQLNMDSKKLRNILGEGMTEKKWKVLLDHAKTCALTGKLYVYYHDNESDGVILNNVGQLSGLTADGVYCATDRFSLQQKVYADRLVKKAYENWNDVRQFNAEASSSSMSEKISCPVQYEVLGDQQCFLPVQDNRPLPRLASQVGLVVPPESSASIVEELQSLNSQNATPKQIIDSSNQMEPSADENVKPFGQPYESISSFLDFNTGDDVICWLLRGE